jgi:RNA polymerase sigma-54 factor
MLLQTQKTALRPLTTAHLAQTMTLLELTSAELREKIEIELARNPALELVEGARCPHCHRSLPKAGSCPVCMAPQDHPSDQPIVFVSPRRDFAPPRRGLTSEDTTPEDWTAAVEDLPTFVLRQIAPELAVEDRPLAAHLLTCLDEDGLLATPLAEIARYHHVLISRIEAVQKMIQRAEPVGVGSSSPQEALLAQLEVLAEYSQHEYSSVEGSRREDSVDGSAQQEPPTVPPLAAEAILKGMELLSRHAYVELGRVLQVSTSEATRIASFISENLNPFPARAHWGDIHQGAEPTQIYQDPDIIISRLHEGPDAPLVLEIASPYVGSLRINPLFRQALAQAPAEKNEQWQSDLGVAILLIKCLQQRNHTLVRLMQRLAILQRKYILEGDAYLIPATRARLAAELEVHESTISRAVSGKAVQLPNKKVVPLAKWFDRSLNVRTAILQIISEEIKPLSDKQITKLLEKQGFSVARRTVAKYRMIEGILPAHLRGLN